MPASADKPLTPRQDAWVHYYTTPGAGLFNGTESARQAGYKGSPNVLAQVGRSNLRKPHIWRAVRSRINEMYSAANLTVERVLSDIEMTRQMALQAGNYTAALRASELHGKYLAMFTERIEHVHTLDDVSTEDLLRFASRLSTKIDGIDIHSSLGGNGAAASLDAGPSGNRKPH